MASEVGVLDVPPERVLQKGRLQPGRMFLIDTEEGRIVADEEIKSRTAAEHPYRDWLNQNLIRLADVRDPGVVPELDHEHVVQRQLAFGYSFEDLRILMAPMARDGTEAPSYTQLARDFHLPSEDSVGRVIRAARDEFSSVLLAKIAHDTESPAEAEGEFKLVVAAGLRS